jgi:hypothetical protein
MKATVKRGSARRLKTPKETARDVGKAAGRGRKTIKRSAMTARYPVAETLRWVADGERLLIKWGAIKSPGAKRIANAVAQVLSVLEALLELRKI